MRSAWFVCWVFVLLAVGCQTTSRPSPTSVLRELDRAIMNHDSVHLGSVLAEQYAQLYVSAAGDTLPQPQARGHFLESWGEVWRRYPDRETALKIETPSPQLRCIGGDIWEITNLGLEVNIDSLPPVRQRGDMEVRREGKKYVVTKWIVRL